MTSVPFRRSIAPLALVGLVLAGCRDAPEAPLAPPAAALALNQLGFTKSSGAVTDKVRIILDQAKIAQVRGLQKSLKALEGSSADKTGIDAVLDRLFEVTNGHRYRVVAGVPVPVDAWLQSFDPAGQMLDWQPIKLMTNEVGAHSMDFVVFPKDSGIDSGEFGAEARFILYLLGEEDGTIAATADGFLPALAEVVGAY